MDRMTEGGESQLKREQKKGGKSIELWNIHELFSFSNFSSLFLSIYFPPPASPNESLKEKETNFLCLYDRDYLQKRSRSLARSVAHTIGAQPAQTAPDCTMLMMDFPNRMENCSKWN